MVSRRALICVLVLASTLVATAAGTLQSPTTARSLTVNTAGTTTFGGAVGGGGNALLSIATDAPGATAINGGSIVTTTTQSFNDAVTREVRPLLETLAGTDDWWQRFSAVTGMVDTWPSAAN